MNPGKGGKTPVGIPAGVFSRWMDQFLGSLDRGEANEVPCGDCIGCCISSYFIHVSPGDVAARRAIPVAHRVPAPGWPAGHELMGYDEEGRCPMLSSAGCTIYRDRPTTCRTYDCRVFAATGIEPGGAEKRTIHERVRAWMFEYPTPLDLQLQEAVRDAAEFLLTRSASFPGGRVPGNPSDLALAALRSHAVFLDRGWAERDPHEIALRVVDANRTDSPADGNSPRKRRRGG
ncbi:MAG: YkgJ family cysteine cluster protein [Fibrobacteria bacterium]|nr:YkgJ family cysteine cluster protein [Fibrobacteria bacterium]